MWMLILVRCGCAMMMMVIVVLAVAICMHHEVECWKGFSMLWQWWDLSVWWVMGVGRQEIASGWVAGVVSSEAGEAERCFSGCLLFPA